MDDTEDIDPFAYKPLKVTKKRTSVSSEEHTSEDETEKSSKKKSRKKKKGSLEIPDIPGFTEKV